MSDKGSDLDIFKDLSKKASSAAAAPAPSPQQVRQKTLLGLQAPPPPFPAPSRAGMSRPPPAPPSRAGGSLPPPPPSRRSAPPPPAPPAASSGQNARPPSSARAGAPGGVDMDWDDEDEKTSIYDRGGSEDAARSLLGGSVPPLAPPPAAGAPPPPMAHGQMGHMAPAAAPPPMSLPGRMPAPPTRPTNRPPPPPPPAMAMPAAPPAGAMPVPSGTLTYPGREKKPTLYIVLAALVVAAVALFFLVPRTGSLVVTVSGPGNKPLDAVQILVNGKVQCETSPCTLDGVKADTYYVRANAAGYQAMADIAVVVSSGGKAVQNLTLVRAMGTGIKVIGEGTGLKLYVDGREVGPLPQEIKDMDPGEHTVRVAGSERFEPFERRITVEPEQMQTIGPLRLKVLKGLATVQEGPGAEGAKVILISGSDRRTLPRLPITLDIPTNQPHTLVATKRGYEQVKLPIKFEDGQVEKTIELAMVETGTGGGTEASEPAPRERPSPPVAPDPAPRTGTGGGGGGTATLNINSIPVSSIILDGRPVGTTPKVGVKVSAGSHTVVFVKGTERKTQSVTVGAGQTKTVVARF